MKKKILGHFATDVDDVHVHPHILLYTPSPATVSEILYFACILKW